MGIRRADERTRTAYPSSSYECSVTRCRGLHRVANPTFLGGFLCSVLQVVAPFCAPGGIRVVSKEMRSCSTIVISRNEHPMDAQHLAGHGSIQSTIDRYSHRIPRALCLL
jgi:hypothetical protein